MTEPIDDFEKLLVSIARTHFPIIRERGFLTLHEKGSDDLDFVDASVFNIRAALEEAYNCGAADALNGAKEE